jgi:hypothetical protein
MPLSFQNLYSETAYVGLPWFDPDGNPGPMKEELVCCAAQSMG